MSTRVGWVRTSASSEVVAPAKTPSVGDVLPVGPTTRKLVIAETATSMFAYHLREVVDGRYYFSGACPDAICGAKLGWDTHFPLSGWGKSTMGCERWCAKCAAAR